MDFEFFLHFGDDFFDAGRMNAAVGNELGQRLPGDLAAHGVETADDHDARRVVDDHVDARRLFKTADVAALAADDATLEIVARDRDGAGRVIRRLLGGVGQLAGTVYAAMGLGIVNKFLEAWSGAVLAKIAVLVFIIVFIQKRPQGLFALKGRMAET
jgi:hypothetical protein